MFVAKDVELNREVAYKQIRGDCADEPFNRTRFLLEAEITGGLEHPGIVPVYGLGVDDAGRPYYAMRFIKGDSLKDAIRRFHQDPRFAVNPGVRLLELQKLLRRFLDVCNAVAYAHSRGVLHRDIKPGNIMVGPYGETLVVDWGLAKVVGRNDPSSPEETLRPPSASGTSETMPGSTIGTPAFMSPEQADGRLDRVGPRSDVYSLGATLYCLLTGRAPIEDADNMAALDKARRGVIRAPRQLKPELPRALEAICQKAMALEPEDRFPTPRHLADDLERWLADEPVSAWREPISVRTRRWMRRHRTLMTTSAAVLILGLVGTGGFAAVLAGKNRELDIQRRAAITERDRAVSAEQAARDEQAKTKTSEAETRTVLTFFQDKVLVAARPEDQEGGLGINTTIRAALDAAEPGVAKAFEGQPLVEASIRNILGESYYLLGEPKLAISQHERALALRREILGDDHPHTLLSINNLGVDLRDAAQFDRAIPLLEQAVDGHRTKLGANDPSTLSAMNNLAGAT